MKKHIIGLCALLLMVGIGKTEAQAEELQDITVKDFRYVNGRVRSLEASSDSLYSVADWQWNDFGLKFERFLVHRTDKATATRIFHQQE